MHVRNRPTTRRQSVFAEADVDDLFFACASCGCSSCLADEEQVDGGRTPRHRAQRPAEKPPATATPRR